MKVTILAVTILTLLSTTSADSENEEKVQTTKDILEGEWVIHNWQDIDSETTLKSEKVIGRAALNATEGTNRLTGTAEINDTLKLTVSGVSRTGNNEVQLTFLDVEQSVDSAPWLVLTARPSLTNTVRASSLPYTQGAVTGTALITFQNSDLFYVRLFPQGGGSPQSFIFHRMAPPGGIMDNWRLFLMTGLGFIFAKMFTSYLMGSNGVGFSKQWQKERATKLTKKEKAAKALEAAGLRRRKPKKQ
eukprot:TRINITY_DN8302_c0_g1_i2.p1 TRINITY_DN8302_c0_g1~~TRINITY_DN8302_c0_g1_i2.p1  ORF type:complete len:246 (+),score=37.90 TRINITY_DN8302_c0_g1_i2:43-780(+)